MTDAADSVLESPRAPAATAATAGLTTAACPSQPGDDKLSPLRDALRSLRAAFQPKPPANRTTSIMSSSGSAAAPATPRAGGEAAPSADWFGRLPEPPCPDSLPGHPDRISEGLFYKDYGAYYE